MSRTTLIAVAMALAAIASAQASDRNKEKAVPASDPASAPAEKLDPKKVDLSKVDPEKVDWSKVDWKKRLTPEEYRITRKAGTERAFTGRYWNFFGDGQYRCVNCGLPLFDSDSKFESHCGWPSFDKSIAKNAITEVPDDSLGMVRTEIRCRRCGAHLGHVFDDGPTETGVRYCVNSASTKFIDAEKLAAEEASTSASGKSSKDADKAAHQPGKADAPPTPAATQDKSAN